MLESLLNKEVTVSIAFGEALSGVTGAFASVGKSSYKNLDDLAYSISGVLVEFDDKFIKLSDGTIIGLMYIRFIKLI